VNTSTKTLLIGDYKTNEMMMVMHRLTTRQEAFEMYELKARPDYIQIV